MPRPPTLVLSFLLLAAPRSALAQCPVPPYQISTGAIDRGRAIVFDLDQQNDAHVRFLDKTDEGWRRVQFSLIGDGTFFHPVQVAIDGDRAIAGSAESTGTDWLSGRAFAFARVGDEWIPGELLPTPHGEATFFGTAVDIDGDVAIVAATHESRFGDHLARVHVFEFDGAAWHETAQIPGDYPAIAVEGDTIVLGDGGHSGQVDVYRRQGGLWVWDDRLFPSQSPPPYGPAFGFSLALENDRLVVGASSSSVPGAPNFVDVFRRTGTSFLRVQHIVPSDSALDDLFGYSVALEGSTLLVGAPGGGSTGGLGRVHRFEHDGTSFVETGSFGPEPLHGSFGQRLALDGEDAIISSWPSGSFYRLGVATTASFCPTTPNSTGAAASLSVEGCDSVAGERMTLVADELPPNVLVHFLVGANTTQVPFGDGFRCIGEPFYRIGAGASDASGSYASDLDFTTSPALGFTAGTTWHFQAAYRDPAGSGTRLNTSNALSVRITP